MATKADDEVARPEPQISSVDEKQDTLSDPFSDQNVEQNKTMVESLTPAAPNDIEDTDSDEKVQAETAEDLVTHVLHVDDDPSVNPWTFRMLVLGMCLRSGLGMARR